MSQPDLVALLVPVVDALEALAVPYQIGGSVASSVLGVPRTTVDADLVVDLSPESVRPLV